MMWSVVIDSRHHTSPHDTTSTMATNITFHPGNITSEERQTILGQKGLTIWLTGLSASGKVRLPCSADLYFFFLPLSLTKGRI